MSGMCAPPFGHVVLGMTSLLLLFQRRHCSSLIFICTNQIVMNIWMNIIKFYFYIFQFYTIFLLNFFYYSIEFYINCSIQFYFLKYFLIITNGFTDRINLSVFCREL